MVTVHNGHNTYLIDADVKLEGASIENIGGELYDFKPVDKFTVSEMMALNRVINKKHTLLSTINSAYFASIEKTITCAMQFARLGHISTSQNATSEEIKGAALLETSNGEFRIITAPFTYYVGSDVAGQLLCGWYAIQLQLSAHKLYYTFPQLYCLFGDKGKLEAIHGKSLLISAPQDAGYADPFVASLIFKYFGFPSTCIYVGKVTAGFACLQYGMFLQFLKWYVDTIDLPVMISENKHSFNIIGSALNDNFVVASPHQLHDGSGPLPAITHIRVIVDDNPLLKLPKSVFIVHIPSNVSWISYGANTYFTVDGKTRTISGNPNC